MSPSTARSSEHSRLAALNLLEDAVLSRQAVENLNAVLRESEARYRTLFDSMDQGYCVIEVLFDENGGAVDYAFLEVNQAFEKETGLHGAQGKRMRDLAPEHEAHWFEIYGKVAVTGESVRFVNEAKAIGGRWFDVYAFRIGKPEDHRVAVLFRDVSANRRAEEALRQSEERFRMLADNISQFAWTADANGSIYWYNQRWYDYTGATLEEMQGWGWTKVLHPDHVERVVKRIQYSWDTGRPWEDNFPLRGTDGSYRWFLSRARGIRDEGGNVLRWFGTNTDITELRDLEEKIQRQAAQLVDESHRKDEFLAMLSHELRNPLAAIHYAEQVLRAQGNGSNSPTQQAAREIIHRQVDVLTRMVGDLLDVSRVVSGRIQLQRSPMDLNQIVRQAVDTVRPLYEKCSHKLRLNLAGEPLWADVDPIRLEQVFVNLLTNAGKYTDDGGHIEIISERVEDGGLDVICFQIRDDGIGIDAALMPHIFDLFTQADRSLARSAGGLGIGLSLVRRLVQLHEGTIEAFSPPRDSAGGKGTEFILRIPGVPAPEILPVSDLGPATGVAAPALKVLVVEDNVDQLAMLSDALGQSGHSVQTANCGPDGLAIASLWQPDVVLLDIGLPGLNGYEVARRLRCDPVSSGTFLVAITGYAGESDVAAAREAGFDAHLAKPLNYAKLQLLLAQRADQSARG